MQNKGGRHPPKHACPFAVGRTQVLLKYKGGAAGTALSFNTNELPCFTLWKNMVASDDGYVVGIEPGTNFPNKRSVEEAAGRVVTLAPGEKWHAEVGIDWLTTEEEVAAVEETLRHQV